MNQNPRLNVISPQQIREQLATLLHSTDFRVSPRIKNILAYIVEETLQGRAGDLKAYSIAVDVLGRDARFDPSTDPIVRVEMGKLRRQLELYYILNPDNPVYIKIPKGSYAPVFKTRDEGSSEYARAFARAGIDLPRELEEPNEPVAKALNQPDSQPDNPAGAAAQAGNGVSGPRPQREVPRTEIRPILAVMPIEFRGDDPDLPGFAKGLTESLLVELSYMHDVESLDGSIMSPDGRESQSLIERSRALGARFALHGTVQRSQDTLRVYIALSDTSSARRIWTEKYDLDSAVQSLLDIQDEVTSKIVGRIADEFGLINQFLLQETRNKELDQLGMYEASLRYNAWVWTFDKRDFIEAQKALEYCYELEPDNVMVCALLSDIYSSDYLLAYEVVDDCLDRGFALAQKALNIDPTHQLALWSLALNYQLRGDLTHINNTLAQIYPLNNTNPFLYLTLGIIIGMTKDMAEGKRLVEEALSINPHSPSWCRIMPFMYYYAHEEYELALGQALHINLPTCVWDPMLRAAGFAMLGRHDDARLAVEQLLEIEPEFQRKRQQLLYSMLINEKYVNMLDAGLTEAGL